MNNLLEFITLTKGVEYLIAIAFLFGFVLFWQLIHSKGKGLVRRTIPLVVLMLAFAGLASTCAMSAPGVATIPPGAKVNLLNSPVLVEMYGPALFDHEVHQRIVDDCTICHHHSGGEIVPCEECHANAFNSEDIGKPSLAHVFHLRCISCHQENQIGPTECTECHSKASIPPLPIAHPLTGVQNCLGCHGNGIPGVPAPPTDHTGVTNSSDGVCQLCHKLAVEASAVAMQPIPHGTTSWQNCLLCHGEGIARAAKVPADHAGRTNETCQLCHKPS